MATIPLLFLTYCFLFFPGNDALSTSSVPSTESKGKWSLFYAFDEKLGNLESRSNSTQENSELELDNVTVNEISQEDAQISTTTMVPTEITTEPTIQTTAATSIATNNLISSLPRMNGKPVQQLL